MKYKKYYILGSIIFLTLIAVTLLIKYIPLEHNTNNDAEKDKVVATIFPYYLMLKELKVSANVVINPYTNPHTYTPSIQDYQKIENAEYVVVDGYLDEELLKSIPSFKKIDPTPYRHGWLRFDALYNLSKILKEKGINNKIPDEIYKLDKTYKNKFKNITAVVLHKGLEDALSYYGIKVIKALTSHDDEMLSINDIQYLKTTDACLIIVTSLAQKNMLEQAGITDKVVYINVMGRALLKCYYSESYLATMKQNLKAIEDAAKKCYNND
ncbi:MAG: zinc ABC transporter substrate-binding protein [Candidatus Nanohaloarchaeota archaeon]|nr:zinc ABC transporter substrate-binding protein [Candidatus Nanohaloarchaeota archaeon]